MSELEECYSHIDASNEYTPERKIKLKLIVANILAEKSNATAIFEKNS